MTVVGALVSTELDRRNVGRARRDQHKPTHTKRWPRLNSTGARLVEPVETNSAHPYDALASTELDRRSWTRLSSTGAQAGSAASVRLIELMQ